MCLCTICHRTNQGPVSPLASSPRGFDTSAVCCRSFSYSRIAEFRSAPSSFLVFRMLLSSSCVGGILGRATVIVNQLREDSKRPMLPTETFVSLDYPRHIRPDVAERRQPAQVRREVITRLYLLWRAFRWALPQPHHCVTVSSDRSWLAVENRLV